MEQTESIRPNDDSNFCQSKVEIDELDTAVKESEPSQENELLSEPSDQQVTNQTCQECEDENEISQSQTCKEKTAHILSNFFNKVENRPAVEDTELEASIKFEFGTEPVNDEPSPKTPEFSEIAEIRLEQTIL